MPPCSRRLGSRRPLGDCRRHNCFQTSCTRQHRSRRARDRGRGQKCVEPRGSRRPRSWTQGRLGPGRLAARRGRARLHCSPRRAHVAPSHPGPSWRQAPAASAERPRHGDCHARGSEVPFVRLRAAQARATASSPSAAFSGRERKEARGRARQGAGQTGVAPGAAPPWAGVLETHGVSGRVLKHGASRKRRCSSEEDATGR